MAVAVIARLLLTLKLRAVRATDGRLIGVGSQAIVLRQWSNFDLTAELDDTIDGQTEKGHGLLGVADHRRK